MSNFTLKLIALIAMTIDHIGYFMPHGTTFYVVCRMIGRLAFPIFLFLLFEGYNHTSNLRKYILSLLIFAIISIYPFYYTFGMSYNVFFTLALGVLLLHFFKTNDNPLSHSFALLCSVIIALPFDWGVVCMFTIYFCKNIKTTKKLAIILPISTFALTFFYFKYLLNAPQNTVNIFSLPILATIPILLLYNGSLGYKLKGFFKYIFYLYYPFHILIIGYLVK